ncbi:RHS repeat-associated core domain-containing protein [Streptomonospora litoralis]|nr:RHS repeat-associated core domain-containing protein [Streptomonospora litoralis]
MSKGTHTYGYDDAGRLTSWTAPGGETTDYEWDASGNRVRAGEETFSYDARNRLTGSGDGDTWSYTPRGTLAQSVVDGVERTPEFDAFERMVASGDGTVEYGYDALGRVATRTEDEGLMAAAETSEFLYGGLEKNNPLAVLDSEGDALSSYGRDEAGELVSIADADQQPALAYLNNHTDLAATYTPQGTTTSSTAFSPFGETVASEGAADSLGFQSEWTDPVTGDVNMHARWYQPGTGRFASRDTMTLEPDPSVQLNRYTYGNGAPMRYRDPSGHFLVGSTGAAVGAGAATSIGLGTTMAIGLGLLGGVGVALAIGFVAYTAYNYYTSSSSSGFSNRPAYRPGMYSMYSGGGSSGGAGSGSGGGSGATATGSFTTTPYATPGYTGGRSWSPRTSVRPEPRRPVVPKVDPRKKILRKILNTPQPRPPIHNTVDQSDVDKARKKAEETVRNFRISMKT